ncbi:ABC transporter substrate-binding protein [Undibacterium sp. SXout11W]|uniref:ABC transporter substrate-binding protein n=1 Tax=Undibacterium sp. SXout11W TaxID=3413050 RepID=UPI003BF36114
MTFCSKLLLPVLLYLGCAMAYAGEKISIVVAGIEKQIYLPVKLAEQLGYFAETGLDIEFLTDRNGINAETELLSGSVQGVIGFYDHTISLQARGKLVKSVIQLTQTPGQAILVAEKSAKEITSLKQLKGRSFGVTGLGSSTNTIIRYLAQKSGVQSSAINILPVGSGDNFINAMMQGRVQAGISSEPTVSRLTSAGRATVLLDLRGIKETQAVFGGAYPAACLYMPNAWVTTHRHEVQKIVIALGKALNYIQTHSASEISEQMPASFYANDKENYVLALKNSKEMFTADGKMPEGGPETVLKVLRGYDKSLYGKHINLNNTFTNEFISNAK